MKLNDTIDFYLKATWHSIVRMYNKRGSEHGISQTIGYVLLHVSKEGSPATQIAPLLGMEPTSISRLLKNMEQMGLIRRQADKKDKRIVRIYLTTKGVEKRRKAKDEVFKFNEKVKKNISQEKLKVFFDVVESINNLAQEELNNTQ